MRFESTGKVLAECKLKYLHNLRVWHVARRRAKSCKGMGDGRTLSRAIVVQEGQPLRVSGISDGDVNRAARVDLPVVDGCAPLIGMHVSCSMPLINMCLEMRQKTM